MLEKEFLSELRESGNLTENVLSLQQQNAALNEKSRNLTQALRSEQKENEALKIDKRKLEERSSLHLIIIAVSAGLTILLARGYQQQSNALNERDEELRHAQRENKDLREEKAGSTGGAALWTMAVVVLTAFSVHLLATTPQSGTSYVISCFKCALRRHILATESICPVCICSWSCRAGDGLPALRILLPCGHELCQRCEGQMSQLENRRCPLCNEEISSSIGLPANG